MKPKVGQKLYSLNVGDSARNTEQKLTPVIVVSVGRKYFKTRNDDDEDGWSEYNQYHIDGWRQKTEYTATSCLYATEQEYLDEKEVYEICRKIYNSFQYGRNPRGYSLDVLRKIKALLDSE